VGHFGSTWGGAFDALTQEETAIEISLDGKSPRGTTIHVCRRSVATVNENMARTHRESTLPARESTAERLGQGYPQAARVEHLETKPRMPRAPRARAC
jgi:hypothetical protein